MILEAYDSGSDEARFALSDYDGSHWENARIAGYDDHKLTEQKSYMLEFEKIPPKSIKWENGRVVYDFGLYPNEECKRRILKLYSENGIS